MPLKKQVTIAELKVGIFVIIAVVLLGALILQQSWGVHWFRETVNAITYLGDVGGLKPGNPVWLAGIEIGKVRSVNIVQPEMYSGNEPIFRQISNIKKQIDSLDPGQPNYRPLVADLDEQVRSLKTGLRLVEVTMEIQKPYLNRLGQDSEVTIESRGLIGDSYIEISAGAYGTPPPMRGGFYVLEGSRATGFREIITGANDVIANFGVLSDQFKNIALKIDPDKVGTGLAATIQDVQKTMRQANATFTQATRLVEDLRTGQGSFGRMVADPALYNRLTESLEEFNSLAGQIQDGSGTLSRLIKNPDLYDSAASATRRTDVVVERVEKGEGTLGKLSKDPALYDASRQTMEKLASFVDRIDRADGTMGKLINDPALYNNLNQTTAEITKLIYDLRQDPKKYLTIRFRIF
jgi:phospholipid/cholesterol/gamma-HCH transport system substrate-binding protein